MNFEFRIKFRIYNPKFKIDFQALVTAPVLAEVTTAA
jgi:hypothetical protein